MPKYHLYRHYDCDDCLLYVGVTTNPKRRLGQHKCTSPWFDEIARVETEQFADHHAALVAEVVAIITEHPVHNKQVDLKLLRRPYHGDQPYQYARDYRHMLRDRLDELDEQDNVVPIRKPKAVPQRRAYEHVCAGCEEAFVSSWPNQRWCEPSCRSRYRSSARRLAA